MIYIKKFFIIFSCMLILVSCFVIPVSAALGESFNGSDNLIDSSSTVNVYVDSSFYGLQPFYLVDLDPNTTYSFISSKSVDRFLCAPIVDNVFYNEPIVYTFDTYNLATVNSFTVTIPINQPYAEHRISGALPVGTYNISYEVDSPIYNINSVFGSGSEWYMLSPSYNIITSSNRTVTGTITITQSMVNNGQNYIYIRPIEGASANGVTASSIKIFLSDTDESNIYIPTYSKTFYKDSQVFVYTFTTPGSLSGQYALGFKDSTIASDTLYSRISSDDNTIYLIAADVSMDSFIEDAYNDGYSDGYDTGFSSGETSGLEASGMLRNLIFTIFSVPFVFIRNALDFEILGINFKNIVLVLLSASLVAWVIRTFKKGE